MPPAKKPNKLKGWADLIGVIKTPLGFYVLALLIVESTLAIVLTFSKLTEEHVWDGFKSMIWVLAAVLLIVTVFVFWKPKNLLYGKKEHHEELLEPSALKDEIKVFKALDKPEYTWRTVSAIARQTGLSEDRVAQILAKYNLEFTRLAET